MSRGQRGPKPTQPPTAPPPSGDPLADLRQESGPILPGGTPPPPAGPPAPPEAGAPPEEPELTGTIRPMVDAETHAEMVAEMVAAWHHDPTSQGFLHGGGACGCVYIARHALQAAVPVMTDDDLEERELEPSP